MLRFCASFVLVCATAAGATGCGSALNEPTPNLEACKSLYDALLKKCPTEADMGFLNCDKLPGCPGPGGNVETSDVTDCVNAVAATATCDQAKLVECTIAKTGCSAPTDEFDLADPIGNQAACGLILAAFNGDTLNCDKKEADCAAYLGCSDGGAFDKVGLEKAIAAADGQSTCAAKDTAFKGVTIEQKFCFDSLAQ